MEHHYIALVDDPEIPERQFVLVVRATLTEQARRTIIAFWRKQGWPNRGLKIRLIPVRDQGIQMITGQAHTDEQAIRAFCEQIMLLANDLADVASRDRLIAMMRTFAIGEKVYQDRYGEDAHEH